jgi:hypothetical protein
MHCDCVRELRVMLYDGSIVTANGAQNTDLYWAMRGGTGGNFGVLLRATLKLFPLVSLLYGWAVRWPLAAETQRNAAAQALMTIQSQLMRTAPLAMNPQVMICFQSDQPDGSDRAPWMLVRGIYVGPKEEGWPLVKPLLGLEGCEFQYDAVDSYLVLNTMLLETPHPIPQLKPGVWPPEDKQARYVSRDLTRQEWRNLLEFFVTETPNP